MIRYERVFFIWALLTCAAIGAPGAGCAFEAGLPPRPNVVFILIDDMGWADAGVYGSEFHETPNIDRLARQGMRFTQAYAAASICSPSRASILTGTHPARLNLTDWIPGREHDPENKLVTVQDTNYLPLEETTIAELLKAEGYATAFLGKWHLGGDGRLPQDQGFDVNVAGNRRGSPPDYFHPYKRGSYQLQYLARTGSDGEYLTDRLGDEAVSFIEDQSEPFFLYLSHYSVHTPLQAKEPMVERYRTKADTLDMPDRPEFGREHGHKERLVQRNPTFAAMVESVDRSVGKVMRALERRGIAEETVIFFFSDNGGLSTDHPSTSNYPLRAGKGWLYEGGIREPLIITWPGVIEPGSVTEEMVVGTDFYPTIAEMVGVDGRRARAPDGLSLVPLLTEGKNLDRNTLYWHYPHYHGAGNEPSGAIRHGDYKLIQYFEDDTIELYNIAGDLGEENNLVDEQPGRADDLLQMLRDWRMRVDAQMPRPTPD